MNQQKFKIGSLYKIISISDSAKEIYGEAFYAVAMGYPKLVLSHNFYKFLYKNELLLFNIFNFHFNFEQVKENHEQV